MKNKVVRKLLMVGLSSSVVLTSTVGVTAASMDATTTDVVVENAAEDEVLTPVEGEEAVTEETSEEVAEEETTEETGEEVAEEETTEDTEKQEEPTYSVDVTIQYTLEGTDDVVGTETVSAGVNKYDCFAFKASDLTQVPGGYELCESGDISGSASETTITVYVREKAAETRSINVNYVDESGNIIGTETVEVPQNAGNFNASLLKNVPEKYALAATGDVALVPDSDSVDVLVRLKEKTIMVNYILEDGSSAGTGNAVVESGANYINTSVLKDVPYGYELASTGDINLNEDGISVNVVVREKDYEQNVFVNYVDEDGNLVLSESIKVHKDTTYINTKDLNIPYGWEVAEAGDMPIKDGAVTVVVRAKEYTKDVIVNYVKENGEPVLTTSIKLADDATYFNTSILKDVPYGYELATLGDVPVSAGNVAYVVVRAKEYTKDVVVNYVKENGEPVLTTSIKLEKDATYFNTSILKDIPYGWELVNQGDIPVGDNNVAYVEVRQKKYTKDVIINYVDEEGNSVATSGIVVDEDATYFNTSILKDVPYGWVLANVGDITINEDNTADVVVREKVYQRDVIINYVDEEGNNVATSGIKLDMEATYFNTSILTDIPYGWELANVGDIPVDFETNSADVVVRQKKYTKDVIINYVDEEGNSVATSGIVVDEEATYFNTSILKDVPYGWELANVGDITINEDNTADVVVRQKVYQRDVIINYVDEEGNNVATSGIKLDMEATYFNTSILTDIPYGWELANVGDIPVDFETNSADVVVRQKKYTKDVIINYVDEEGNSVATSGIVVDEEATYFNTSILKDVPYGWELANVGDITINEDNTADVVVRQKVYQRDVVINYVDEEGNNILTSGIKLDENATYFNTSILTDVPYGWEIAVVGDIPVDFETNSANVVVRQKKYTKDVTVKYVTEEGEEVGTGTLVVDEKDTYINTSILTDVPEGYVIAIIGDLPIEDNTVVVTVRAEKEDPEEPTPTPDPEEPTPTPDPEEPTPTPNPEAPDQPIDPENPTPTPDQNKPTVAPEKPNNNNNQNNDQNKADTNKSEVKTNNPKTGDATNTVPLVAGLLGSGSMIGLIQMLRRKKK